MALGAGGIRACTLAFTADQINNHETPQNERTMKSFFNWVGCELRDFYGDCVIVCYNVFLCQPGKTDTYPCLPRTLTFGIFAMALILFNQQTKFLNKACIIKNREKDLAYDGRPIDPWSQCTVRQVEELKAIIRVLPIWSTGIILATTVSQQSFFIVQTVPFWPKERIFTVKQRMGIGLLISCFAIIVVNIVAVSIFTLSLGVGNLVGSLIIKVVKDGRSWLASIKYQ
ncbi:hypothetical protein JHK85_014137 [Glycine max]|nr:hypothetical protein JHK85_014137 [Glycine max]KAG5058779.1 hypothetical protein JHK86_013775 [Glycine max]